jgi:hypothetical protein
MLAKVDNYNRKLKYLAQYMTYKKRLIQACPGAVLAAAVSSKPVFNPATLKTNKFYFYKL